MKKLLALVLALVMTLSLATVSSNAAFKDAKDINETYAEAAEVLAGMGVFKGYEEKDGTFSFNPKGDITRAEVAAIIYRIYTADVAKNDKSGLYATYNKFSDMAGAGWAAGYIGYCANAEFVKGYPDGTFKPLGKVTGYEVLAMILRAVGYDQKGEFTGAGWQLHVAQIAEQQGILDNVKGVDLNAAATRELVAELLFRAVQIPLVTYTAAFGYQNVTLDTKADNKLFSKNVSLGYKNFGLIDGEDEDKWGRPVKVWAKDADKDGKFNAKKDTTAYAKIVATPDAAYHVATAECDICKDLSASKKATIAERYDNGVANLKYNKEIVATATKATLGEQGQQIEFYKLDSGDYRMVVIDTYLAKVTKVVAEKLDKNGHVDVDDYTALVAYVGNKGNDPKTEEIYVAGNDYEKGDYVLVNINEVSKVSFAGVKGSQKYIDVLGKAESLDGAQSAIWKNGVGHTIEGKDYDDAYKFYLDEAGKTGTVKFTWFLDQFGNLIGDVAIDTSNYAVLKDIVWEKNDAVATLVYMDGTEGTVNVSYIDGAEELAVTESDSDLYKTTGGWVKKSNDAIAELEDTASKVGFDGKKALISTASRYNDVYEGLALYRVDTQKDGTVALEGLDTNNDEIVNYDWLVTIDTYASVITNALNGKKLSINDNTQFIVRSENDKGEYVYTPYNRNTLPDYAKESAEIYYTMSGNFVNRVYIKNAIDAEAFGDHLFVTTEKAKMIPDDANTWIMEAVVDGKTVNIFASETIIDELAANVGKLYHVEWDKDWFYNGKLDTGYQSNPNYGYVTEVRLINENEDADNVSGYYAYEGDCDYVTGKDVEIAGNVLYSNHFSWSLTDDTKVIYLDGNEVKTGDKSVLTDNDLVYSGLWVIAADKKYAAEADTIYVGDRLDGTNPTLKTDESTDVLAISAKDGKVEESETNGVDYDYTAKTDATTGDKLYIKVNDENTVVVCDDVAYLPVVDGKNYVVTLDIAKGAEKVEFTVCNEAATDSEDYVVACDWPVSKGITMSDAALTVDTEASIGATAIFTLNTVNEEIKSVSVQMKDKETGDPVYTTMDVSNIDEQYVATVLNTFSQGKRYVAEVTVTAKSGTVYTFVIGPAQAQHSDAKFTVTLAKEEAKVATVSPEQQSLSIAAKQIKGILITVTRNNNNWADLGHKSVVFTVTSSTGNTMTKTVSLSGIDSTEIQFVVDAPANGSADVTYTVGWNWVDNN